MNGNELRRMIREAEERAWAKVRGDESPFTYTGAPPSAADWMPVLLLTLAEEIRMEIDFKEDWGAHNDGFEEANKVIAEIQETFNEIRNT